MAMVLGNHLSRQATMQVSGTPVLSSKLHYFDVEYEKQIGEGSFGILFKGTFRGNDVALKKMKDVGR